MIHTSAAARIAERSPRRSRTARPTVIAVSAQNSTGRVRNVQTLSPNNDVTGAYRYDSVASVYAAPPKVTDRSPAAIRVASMPVYASSALNAPDLDVAATRRRTPPAIITLAATSSAKVRLCHQTPRAGSDTDVASERRASTSSAPMSLSTSTPDRRAASNGALPSIAGRFSPITVYRFRAWTRAAALIDIRSFAMSSPCSMNRCRCMHARSLARSASIRVEGRRAMSGRLQSHRSRNASLLRSASEDRAPSPTGSPSPWKCTTGLSTTSRVTLPSTAAAIA